MGKKRGIKNRGLQKRTVMLVLGMLLITVAVLGAVSEYQNRMLVRIVGETRTEQQQAISGVSEETMHQILTGTLVDSTVLRAGIADSDFAEVVNDTYMLQSMAQGLIENRESVDPMPYQLPDPARDGTPSAMVLYEAGVDYTASKYLGIIAHMSDPMIAMFRNSDKIAGCFVGLSDGTHLGVDDRTLNRFDGNGDLIPFPVRERPWYRGAAETGKLFFTGIVKDAYSGVPGITCSAPVIVDGETVGVVGIDVVLESMSDFIDSSETGGAFSFIVNDRGHVILAPEDNGLFTAAVSDEAQDLRESEYGELAGFVREALQETTDLKLLEIDGREYYAAGAPMPTVGWAVITLVDRETTEQPAKLMLGEYDRINSEASDTFRSEMNRTKRIGWILIAALFVLGSLLALAASGRIVRPLEEMTSTIIANAGTDRLFEMKDCYRTNDEIQVLAEAFDDLSEKTKQYIEDITRITREKERVSVELDMANQIQHSMLPHIFPAFPHRHEFDIYASMTPAKEVGGDFYDFFLIDEDHLCVIVADVSGKGIPAALFMMIAKVVLHNCAMLGKSAADILERTNEALCRSNQVDMFVTVWLGILEISTGIITAANAGHEFPALKQGGSFSLLQDRHGFVVGGMEDVQYSQYEIRMNPGDKLFLYTDGVVEAEDPDKNMFGAERMLAALNEEPETQPEKILEIVRKAVDGFANGAEQFDDLTMLCIEYSGPDAAGEDKA